MYSGSNFEDKEIIKTLKTQKGIKYQKLKNKSLFIAKNYLKRKLLVYLTEKWSTDLELWETDLF